MRAAGAGIEGGLVHGWHLFECGRIVNKFVATAADLLSIDVDHGEAKPPKSQGNLKL
jgi:hypothetical protein